MKHLSIIEESDLKEELQKFATIPRGMVSIPILAPIVLIMLLVPQVHVL
jgi:hypothetical protein